MNQFYQQLWLALATATTLGLLANAAHMALRYGRYGPYRWWFRGIGLMLCALAYDKGTTIARFYSTPAATLPEEATVWSVSGVITATLFVWGWFVYATARNGSSPDSPTESE